MIWFCPLPPGNRATDFRTQTYRGRPVLTRCQGIGRGSQLKWTDYICNDRYQRIAKVTAGHGFATDYHEVLITPWNTALITATRLATVRLGPGHGPVRRKVIDDVVQEIDIATGQVQFRWNALGHVPLRDSEEPGPASAATPWDWFHVNAVHLDTDGNLLISSRYTRTTYKVSRRTGRIIWELGGKLSTFTLRAAPGQVLDKAGEIFACQHDPEALVGEADEGMLAGLARSPNVSVARAPAAETRRTASRPATGPAGSRARSRCARQPGAG